MTEKYNELALKDFVAWVRYRNAHGLKIDSDTLEYVADGIEQFLEGKTPWKKPRGNKSKPELMWHIFWLCYFYAENPELLTKRHKEKNGLYEVVGKKFNLSADATESHFRKALVQYNKPAGKVEFMQWLAKYKGVAMVKITPKKYD